MDIRSITTKRNIIFFIGFIILLIFFYKISDIVLLFFIGFVLASAVDPVVNRLNRKMPRNLAVLTSFALGIILFLGIIIPLVNVLIGQAILFAQNFPAYWNQADRIVDNFAAFSKNLTFIPGPKEIFDRVYGYANAFFAQSVNFTLDIASSIGAVITLVLVVYLMLSDKDHLKSSFLDFFPNEIRDKAESMSISIFKKVGGYVTGTLLAMTVTGILTTIGLAIAGVNYSVLLGLIAGLLDIIPVVGPVIALIIAALVALAEKPIMVIWVLIVFGIVQWSGNVFVRPFIFSRVLELHPLLIIFSLIVAGKLLGVVGVIIAPAIAATGQVLIQELYLKQINPKPVTEIS